MGSTSTTFTASLDFGSYGPQVAAVQGFLSQYPELYPEGYTTGYFGNMTKSAVQRFQEKYNIADSNTPGYGRVGPKTRAKLNELDQ